jgi:uncharacterized Zn-binding protein involved in type VI secretion
VTDTRQRARTGKCSRDYGVAAQNTLAGQVDPDLPTGILVRLMKPPSPSLALALSLDSAYRHECSPARRSGQSLSSGEEECSNIVLNDSTPLADGIFKTREFCSMPSAARLGDNHVCPLAPPGTPPHVGGPVIPPCCPTVVIGGHPAARVTDPLTCIGPPDTISRGAETVLIGGLPAARMTDNTIHGGTITIGSPNVFIGGPLVTFPFSVQGTKAQIEEIQLALALLYTTPSGQSLIASIASTRHVVTIRTTTGGSNCAPGVAPGVQSDTTVSWNPAQGLPGLPAGNPRSGAVVLGHELCHAEHAANGTNANGPYETHPGQSGASARGEERQTVGSAPPYDASGNQIVDADGNPAGTHVRAPAGTFVPDTDHSSRRPTENSIRSDFGFGSRPTYYPPTWPGGPPW